jgi:hypothetical protein
MHLALFLMENLTAAALKDSMQMGLNASTRMNASLKASVPVTVSIFQVISLV